MLILDTTTRSVEIILAGAITTTQLPFTASYVDITPTSFTPGTNDGASNSTTAVTMVAAPVASTQRQLKFVNVYNADTVAANVTVRLNDNATTRILIKAALNPGDTLQFMDTQGWSVISNLGQIKTGVASRQFSVVTRGATTGIASLPGLMGGLAGAITPQGSGNVLIIITGYGQNSTATAGDGYGGQIRYGTGTAPINGAALTGTAVGAGFVDVNERASSDFTAFTMAAIVTGLTPGTTYWIDAAINTLVAGTAIFTSSTIIAIEL